MEEKRKKERQGMKDERALFTMLMNHFLHVYPQAAENKLVSPHSSYFTCIRLGLIACFFFLVVFISPSQWSLVCFT